MHGENYWNEKIDYSGFRPVDQTFWVSARTVLREVRETFDGRHSVPRQFSARAVSLLNEMFGGSMNFCPLKESLLFRFCRNRAFETLESVLKRNWIDAAAGESHGYGDLPAQLREGVWSIP